MASKTIAASSTLRVMGPILSMLQLRAIAPCRLTLPYEGRSPVAPFRVDRDTIEPRVSVPMANGKSPAAVPEADPADDPLEPCSRSHGLFVRPPNQISPYARAPSVVFAIRTAPASSSFDTTVAVS